MGKTLGEIRTRLFRIRSWLISPHKGSPGFPLLITCIVSFSIFATFSILRQLAVKTTYFDLGLYASSIWKTTHGYDPWTSLIFPSSVGHIGHFSPVLGLVALVYWLLPDPVTLLVVQSGALVAAAVPLYLLALRETGRAKLSLLVSGAYLLNPGLHGIVRFDFHVEAFVPLFIFLLFFFQSRGSYQFFSLSLALLLATIEFSAVIGIGMAVLLTLERKRIDKFAITATVLSSALLAIFLSSALSPRGLFGWPSNWLVAQLQGVNSATSSGLLGSLENPISLRSSIEYDLIPKLVYLVLILAPTGLGFLKHPLRMLPSVPWIAVLLVSQRPSFYSVDFQYSAFIIPFAYLASIPFLRREFTPRVALSILTVAIVVMMLTSALSPLRPLISTPYTQPYWASPTPLSNTLSIIHASLPTNATILTQNDIFPQISDRPFATINYSARSPPDYILVNTGSPWYDWSNPGLGIPLSAHQQVDELMKNYTFETLVSSGGLALYRLSSLQSPR